jgi:hypothetical protein
MKISDLVSDIFYNPVGDEFAIHAGKYIFYIPQGGFEHLKYGLEAHYTQNEYLLGCSNEELKELGKIRPKRSSLAEIEYQIERKSFDFKHIRANELISRLPVFSQSRNRNGKQSIADSRWKNAIKNENPDVMHLIEWYEEEESYIRTRFPTVKWTKGSFAISPCHIYPAKKDRGEESWTPDKILRDLSIVNKVFDKISASKLKGKHAIDNNDALIAINYLDEFNWNELSISRQVLYVLLHRRIAQNFYNDYKITDIDLDI